LVYIGLVTAIVGDIAILLGCEIGLKESITAITIVALGTSLPDTFASMTAAKTSEYADSAIGNVTAQTQSTFSWDLDFHGLLPLHTGQLSMERITLCQQEILHSQCLFS